MPPDATETKRRILAASRAEFARYGLAGARVDRIALNARANKRSLYLHFGAKEELFDLVVGTSLLELAEAVPFDAADLPTYAADLFDLLHEHPDVARLTSWAVLERPHPIEAETGAYREKIAAIADAQAAGIISADHDPAILMVMIIALVTGWTNSSWALRSLTKAEAENPPARFRDDLITAVRATLRPSVERPSAVPRS